MSTNFKRERERQRESRGEINFIPPSVNLCVFVVVHLDFVCICKVTKVFALPRKDTS